MIVDENPVTVKILAFGAVRETVQFSEQDLRIRSQWSGADELKKFLCTKLFPQLQQHSGSLILALNQNYLNGSETIVLNDLDTIALIPPITGG